MVEGAWFVRRSQPGRRFRLYCFSYAGGNAASYLGWQSQLPPQVEICAVQLPGRGSRLREPPLYALPPLIDTLVPLVAQSADLPFAFFGHSLGALVAFETARGLARVGGPAPRHLFVSGCQAPRLRDPPKGHHLLDDAGLLEVLADYNGTPPEILADQDLMAMLLPIVRADFTLAETYRYVPGAPLSMPISAFAGEDEERSGLEQVTGWSQETSAGFDHCLFEGGHFFIQGQREHVLARIGTTLARGVMA